MSCSFYALFAEIVNFITDLFQSNESDQSEDQEYGEVSQDGTDNRIITNLYKPPKLAAVPYGTLAFRFSFVLFNFWWTILIVYVICNIKDDTRKAEKQRELLEKAKKRALNSSVMRELKEEYLDTPLEVFATNTLRNAQTKYRKEKEE